MPKLYNYLLVFFIAISLAANLATPVSADAGGEQAIKAMSEQAGNILSDQNLSTASRAEQFHNLFVNNLYKERL